MKRFVTSALMMIQLAGTAGGTIVLAQSAQGDVEFYRSLKASFLSDTQIEGRRVVAMAKGIAADKFGWKPANDNNLAANRPLASTFLNLAWACWTRPSTFGAAPPSGFDLNQKAADYENSTTDKDKIAEQMTRAFAYAEESIRKLSEADLAKHVKLANGRDTTVGALVAAMVEYNSEHVGQLMIYSRVNGFIPPTPGQVATPQDGK